MNAEKQRLETVATDSLYTTMSNIMTIEYSYKIFQRFLRPGNILEMGPAEGIMTEHLYRLNQPLTLLEGSTIFCSQLKEKFPAAEVINSLFEEFEPKLKYDNIILGHVLEHVENPVAILRQVKTYLNKDGVILSAVPNSRSLHRQAAVIMDLLPGEDGMSELDIHHGHRRIYNPESFRQDFIQAGLKVAHFGGYWLKPVSNAQIHSSWTKEMLNAFMELGERYPDIAGEIYVIAKNK
jgi:2-polyprenyl-3-methyl-5-hydroxy-6-metoxy-1,4-benzoquinol methylase